VCGDAIPSGATGHIPQQRAPSVPAPANTTQKAIAVPNATPVPGATGARVRTQWTGNLNVPQMDDGESPKPRSKLALFIGGGVVLFAGAAIAVVMAMKGGGDKPKDPIGTPSGSAPIVTATPDAADVAPPSIDAAAIDLPALPPVVVLAVDSKPRGADIVDLANKTVVGKTPLSFNLTPAHTTRQFALRFKGYNDAVFEVVPNKAKIDHSEKLVRGAGGTTPVGSAGSAGSAVVRPPDGSNTPTPVDAGTPRVRPVDPGCLDDDDLTPCIKDPLGSGGSGS